MIDLRFGDCLEVMKAIPDKTNIQFYLTNIHSPTKKE